MRAPRQSLLREALAVSRHPGLGAMRDAEQLRAACAARHRRAFLAALGTALLLVAAALLAARRLGAG